MIVYQIVLWRGCGNSMCVFLGEIYIVTSLSIVYVGLCNLKCTSKKVWIEKQTVILYDKWTYHDVKKRDSEMYKQNVIINNISIDNNTEIVEIGLYYGWSLLQITTKDLQVWGNLSKVPDINAWNISLSIYALKCKLVIVFGPYWILMLPKMISIFDQLQNRY
mgnify:CR=1 FL=1